MARPCECLFFKENGLQGQLQNAQNLYLPRSRKQVLRESCTPSNSRSLSHLGQKADMDEFAEK